jgi:RHO1 GDP-GTP exchange protein 1/2
MRTVVTARASRNGTGQQSVARRAEPYPPVLPLRLEGKSGFGITFVHLGRKFYQMTLWAATHANHRKWIESITSQQDLMRDRSRFFEMEILSESFFQSTNRANCAVPFSESCSFLLSRV